MPAYMLELHTPRCECGKKATHEVRSERNEPIRKTCVHCAGALVAKLNGK